MTDLHEHADKVLHVRSIVSKADYCKNAFFWQPAKTAKKRRYREQMNTIKMRIFEYDGDIWQLAYSYEESCNHVYAQGIYYRNDKKTTLRAVRNLLAKMQADLSEPIYLVSGCSRQNQPATLTNKS